MKQFATVCPNIKLIKQWKCHRPIEYAALVVVSQTEGVTTIGPEVFEVPDAPAVFSRLDSLFELLGEIE